MIQAFDRDGLERLMSEFNLELLVGSINLQDDRLTVIVATDVVFEFVHLNRAGGIHAPGKQLTINCLQPSIRINRVGERGQVG